MFDWVLDMLPYLALLSRSCTDKCVFHKTLEKAIKDMYKDDFYNKAVDIINLPAILCDPNNSLLEDLSHNLVNPTFVYRLGKIISTLKFSFKRFFCKTNVFWSVFSWTHCGYLFEDSCSYVKDLYLKPVL